MPKNKVMTEKEVKGGAKPTFKKIIRIADTDLDGAKRLEHALISIKGISWSYANAIRKALGFENKKLSEFTNEELEKLKKCLSSPKEFGIPSWLLNRRKDFEKGEGTHLLSSLLVLAHKMDIKRLKSMKCYRGIRHMFNYKVRGQRTRSRGANVRGRVGATVGVVRRKQQPGKKK